MKIDYAVQIVWSEEDNAYIAIAGELPGCLADGKTQEEALANLKVVIGEWIEVANEEKREVPKPLNVEDMARLQAEAQAKLQQQIESEVRKTTQQLLAELVRHHPTTSSWQFRGGLPFDPSQNLEAVGGSRRR